MHGSAPDIAGQDIANPLAMVLTGALMLNALGHSEASSFLEDQVGVLMKRGDVTADLRRSLGQSTEGALGTRAVGDALIQLIQDA